MPKIINQKDLANINIDVLAKIEHKIIEINDDTISQLTDEQSTSLNKYLNAHQNHEGNFYMLPCPKDQRYPRVITDVVLKELINSIVL